jgi:fumarate reductase subunit C
MLTRLAFTAIRAFLAREAGDTMSQVAWSLGFVLLVGVIAVVVGPELGANWREFVGKPAP